MKRALIITYYWPPAGGPGVQRWLKFVTYFKEFGIEPVVFIPDNPHYPLQDKSIASEIPEGIEIIRFPIKEPYGFAKMFSKNKTNQVSSGIITNKNQSVLEKLLLWIRGNFFIPDARIGWVKPSVRFLKKYLAKNEMDIVISSGPPHSLHLIAMALKEELGIKWVADFRDPWTTIHYHQSLRLNKRAQKKHLKLESQVLNNADLVVVTSLNTKKEFQKTTNKPIEVITNGYDISEKIESNLDAQFSIVHIGSLLTNRNPEILWEVLSELKEENKAFSKALLIKLVGTVSEDVLKSIEAVGLTANYKTLGYVSHQEAIQIQHDAQVLLLVEMDSPETKSIIPGKLFEYVAANRPILALGPDGSDVEGILKETNSGNYFNYTDKEKLKKQLQLYYEAYLKANLNVNSQNTEKYSRRELTKSLSSVLLNIK
ncbi:MAG: glycosyltransferase family 4 protein [Flavobacteriales bacterium]|jgi:hypothetical protein